MTTGTNGETRQAGLAAGPADQDDGLASPYEDLLMLAAARAKQLPALIVGAAESSPKLLAAVAAVAVGGVVGLVLAGRRRSAAKIAAPLAAAKAAVSSSWADPANYAELAELVSRLVRNPLVREVLINLAMRQLKRRLG